MFIDPRSYYMLKTTGKNEEASASSASMVVMPLHGSETNLDY